MIDNQRNYPAWSAAIALALAMFAVFDVVGRVDMVALNIELGETEAPIIPANVAYALKSVTGKHCPPADGESLPIVTLHIRSQADEQPEVIGCTRYTKRPFIPKKRVTLAGAQ